MEDQATTPADGVTPDSAVAAVRFHRDAFGKSGALRTRQSLPGEKLALRLEWPDGRPAEAWYRWRPAKGNASERSAIPLGSYDAIVAPKDPGIYTLEIGAGNVSRILDDLQLIVQVPFKMKQGAYLQGYFIGRYPTEGQNRTDRYAPPEGFIEVTRENQNLKLSKHFTLREFLTKDQKNVWPKYVVVDERLIEKLELVMAELNAMGVKAERMVVMSGYRTPQYNSKGLNRGRAQLSRHQYGDAADVWVDNDGNWYMDDLNGDGRRDTRDARVILQAVDRVEAKYPELVGGAGIYPDNGVHGPFIHIDVRGKKARW